MGSLIGIVSSCCCCFGDGDLSIPFGFGDDSDFLGDVFVLAIGELVGVVGSNIGGLDTLLAGIVVEGCEGCIGELNTPKG